MAEYTPRQLEYFVAVAEEAALAFPGEGLATFGADLAVPPAVVDLAERGEDLAAGGTVHLQDRGEVLEDEDAEAGRDLRAVSR